MVARLSVLEGVQGVEADHSGQLLRLRLSGADASARVRAALGELGYAAQRADADAVPVDVAWFGAAEIRELSREEANTIARRALPVFSRSRAIDAAVEQQLTAAVSRALYECLASHVLGPGASRGALREDCSRAVEQAARGVIDEDGARELAAALRRDL